MRKTYSELTAADLLKWCARHRYMKAGEAIAVAVRRGAPEALRISRRQFYDYAGGHMVIPEPIAALMQFYDWYPRRATKIKETEQVT